MSKIRIVQKKVPANFSTYFPLPCTLQNPGSGIGRGVTFIIQIHELRDAINDPHQGVVVVAPGLGGHGGIGALLGSRLLHD